MILEIKDLYKIYKAGQKNEVRAVNGLSVKVPEGTCFGLLGPNGAGKSTTIEVIEGIKDPSSGEILFRGQKRDKNFKNKIGIQFQSTALQDYMTVREALEVFSHFYPKTMSVERLIELCQLDDIIERDHRHLSGGQRQRLLLALALVNDPELIFLDEPTTGLDPQARQMFWQLIEGIKKQNKTIILTTHYMDEAYVLCDEIVIVDQGKIIAEGSPQSLLQEHFKAMKVSLPKVLKDNLGEAFPWAVIENRERIEFHTENVNETLEFLIKKKVSLDSIEVSAKTLEDLFIDLTGKELRS